MPLIETKGAASAQGFGLTLQQAAPVYIEDVFQTWLYTGNSTTGGTQTITNGIDLSTRGGMVWIKGRSAASDHILTDTTRGAGTSATNNQALASNLTSAEDLGGSSYDYLSSFSTTGFVVTQGGTTTATRGTNYSNVTYASWTFRKQPKFFDVVTYTGNGTNPRNISHNLGSVPGCIIIKQINASTQDWRVYHRSLGPSDSIYLNLTNASNGTSVFANTNPTASVFTVSDSIAVNGSGTTYVAYLFAHDAGGFGLTGTDNVISCGSFTTDGSGNATVNLGYEPQWLLFKSSSGVSDWLILDTMRDWSLANTDDPLAANSSADESAFLYVYSNPTATGFSAGGSGLSASTTYIYIAIRRGPMKIPTTGTSVFAPFSTSSTTQTTNFPVDLFFNAQLSGSTLNFVTASRLLSGGFFTSTSLTDAERATASPADFASNTTVTTPRFGANSKAVEALRRAPGFFDVVCYTGNGAAQNITHNLGAVPELIIVKSRSAANDWPTTAPAIYGIVSGGYKYHWFNLDNNNNYADINVFPASNLTSTTFRIGSDAIVGGNGTTYVAYLFASCPGVSKVGSYTGTGALQTINCGFTGGARFVLIKRTDSAGDWWVYDSARGITSGNDPYLFINSSAAEVTGTNYVDTDSTGFKVTAAAPAGLNASGGTYLFLAIA